MTALHPDSRPRSQSASLHEGAERLIDNVSFCNKFTLCKEIWDCKKYYKIRYKLFILKMLNCIYNTHPNKISSEQITGYSYSKYNTDPLSEHLNVYIYSTINIKQGINVN